MTSTVTDPQQQKRLAFSILEYLQDYKNTASAEIAESLEVAIQCISDSFSLSLSNDQDKAQYSIQPLNLGAVFGLGLARKEQIESALASAQASAAPAAAAPAATATATTTTPGKPQELENDLEKKFTEYCRLLTEKNYFAGATEGSTEYKSKLDKARAKFMEKFPGAAAPAPTPTATPVSPTLTTTSVPVSPPSNHADLPAAEKTKKAEEYKNLGNQKLSANQYQEAIDYYTKAIEYDATNAIYYANRAAGYSHLNKHREAIEDCNRAIERNPNYSKAYSRLGLANFSLGNFTEASNAYKKALEIDPTNAVIRTSLEAAEKKARESSMPADQNRSFQNGLADIINNPLFQNLAQNLSANNAGGAAGGPAAGTGAGTGSVAGTGAGAGAGGAGGMPDISQLLNNPSLMNMAQNMMSQPGFSDMLNNPAMMNMAQSFMQNPEALSGILQGVFGNQANPAEGGEGGGTPQ